MIAALLPALLKIADPIIDALFETEDEKSSAKIKLLNAQTSGELKKSEIALSAIVAEAKSADPWTSRARPSFMYVMYTLLLTAIPMGVLFAVDNVVAMDVMEGMRTFWQALPKEVWYLFGAGYLGYGTFRTVDKKNMMKMHSDGS